MIDKSFDFLYKLLNVAISSIASAGTTMLIDDKVLLYVATNVLDGMLGMKVVPLDRPGQLIEDLVASIRISGDWNAGLEVRTSVRGANSIAMKFFEPTMESLSTLDVSDALGEIANMIGGNIKGMCWGETRLSIPVVHSANRFALHQVDGARIEASMQVGDDVLSVLVLNAAD